MKLSTLSVEPATMVTETFTTSSRSPIPCFYVITFCTPGVVMIDVSAWLSRMPCVSLHFFTTSFLLRFNVLAGHYQAYSPANKHRNGYLNPIVIYNAPANPLVITFSKSGLHSLLLKRNVNSSRYSIRYLAETL